MQILFVVVAVVMGILAIMFLVFGILATGATRQNIYSGAKCIMGGRISALFVSINVTTSTVYFEMYNKLASFHRFALLSKMSAFGKIETLQQ